MVGRNNEYKFVKVDDHRMQSRFLRFVRKNTEFRLVTQHIVGNMAAQGSLHSDFDHGVHAPEFRKKWPKFGELVKDVEPALYDVVQIEAA